VGQTVNKTYVQKKTLAPSWEEDFQITVQEPARQTLLVQVRCALLSYLPFIPLLLRET
jgi:Ca2+-dependent lipid-binding protein